MTTDQSRTGRDTDRCPCGTGAVLADCCGKYLRGLSNAPTAVALMRSRYTAFTLMNTEYLLNTWHLEHRPESLDLDPTQIWTGLDIVDTERGGIFDSAGVVEFRAHFRFDKKHSMLHERSRFTKIGGRWLYLDGDIR